VLDNTVTIIIALVVITIIIIVSNAIIKNELKNLLGRSRYRWKKTLKIFRKKYIAYELNLFGSVQDPEVKCHK
jgi:hypothetical protein